MQTTREQILEILQRRKGATADELAKALQLAPATVRRHLDVLQRDNLISFEQVRQKMGRPCYSFLLTEQGQERLHRDYHRLAGWLLQETSALNKEDLQRLDGKGVLSLVLDRTAERRALAYAERMVGKGLGERVAELAQILNEEGYLSEYQEEENFYQIKVCNCPYSWVATYFQMVSSNRQLCSLDLGFARKILGAKIVREQCLAEGNDYCTYRIEKNEQDTG